MIVDPIHLKSTGVYIIKNILTNVIYIGSTTISFKERCRKHFLELVKDSHPNRHLQFAWNKHGEESFTFEVLEECSKDICLEREQHYLDTILFAQEYINFGDKRFLKLGYNLSPTASNTYGSKPEPEVIERIKKIKKEREFAGLYSHIKRVVQYDLEGNYINVFSSSSEAGRALKCRSHEISDVCRLKTRKAKGYQWRFYNDNYLENIGKVRNKKLPKCKHVLQFDSEGNFIREWSSTREIVATLNINRSTITSMCNNKIKTRHGYIFKYKN